jgi:hypothetical protein
MRSPMNRTGPAAALAVAALAQLAMAGCALDPEDDAALASSADDAPSLSWEDFRDSVPREPWAGGAYIVDGDIAIHDEAGLRAFYDGWRLQQAAAAGALTVRNVSGVDKIWPSLRGHELSYCVSNDFGARKAQVVSTLRLAASSWSDLASVQYRYRADQDGNCTSGNGNVLFDVRPVSGVDYFARSFFPDDVRSARELLITTDAFTTSAGGRDFQGILRHELGHTLGFRHEHIHIACTTEDTDDSRKVTSYDVNSVMHYPQCRPSGTGGYRQTSKDYQGAILLYGLSAPLITATVN